MPVAIQATSERIARSIAATSLKEFTLCSRMASGTRTPSRVMWAFCIIRSEVLPWIFSSVTPAASRSTRKALTCPSATSRANTASTSAVAAPPIQRLAPSSTQCVPLRGGPWWKPAGDVRTGLRFGQGEDALEREVDNLGHPLGLLFRRGAHADRRPEKPGLRGVPGGQRGVRAGEFEDPEALVDPAGRTAHPHPGRRSVRPVP